MPKPGKQELPAVTCTGCKHYRPMDVTLPFGRCWKLDSRYSWIRNKILIYGDVQRKIDCKEPGDFYKTHGLEELRPAEGDRP